MFFHRELTRRNPLHADWIVNGKVIVCFVVAFPQNLTKLAAKDKTNGLCSMAKEEPCRGGVFC